MELSVVIPTRNRLALLKETLGSLLAQTRPAGEIVVVDAGSSDGTATWLSQQNLHNLHLIQAPASTGPGAARNLGLAATRGRYIKFFDSDDLLTRNTMEVQVEALERTGRGFVYSPYFHARKSDAGAWEMADPAILNYYPVPVSRPLRHWMVRGLFITIPGMLFRRELLEETGPWREDVTASEDWDYLWRLADIEPFPAHTNACAFLYRIHGRQTTETNMSSAQRDRDKLRVLLDIWERDVRGNTSLSAMDRKLFENKLYQVFRMQTVPGDDFRAYDTWSNRLVWQYYRISQKLGRLRTHTNWQPFHGALVSEEKFKGYLRMIEPQSYTEYGTESL